MAGRKLPPEQNFFSMLLGKLGLGSAPPPRKKRRKRAITESLAGADVAGDAPSPFADYGAHSGLMEGAQDAPEPAFEGPDPAAFSPAAVPPAPAPIASGGRLFEEAALDSSLDALFSGLESGLGSAVTMPPETSSFAPPAPAPAPAPEPTLPVKAPREPLFDEFGLSAPVPIPQAAPAGPTPPAPGSSRVIHAPIVAATPAPAPQPATPQPVAAPPRPAPQAVPGALRAAPALAGAPADALQLARGVDLQALLGAVAAAPGVGGALLVGHDGLLIAARLPGGVDAETLGAQACATFTGVDGQAGRLGQGALRRMLLETASGAMLLTAADMGILVVVSRDGQQMDLAAVVGAIAAHLGPGV